MLENTHSSSSLYPEQTRARRLSSFAACNHSDGNHGNHSRHHGNHNHRHGSRGNRRCGSRRIRSLLSSRRVSDCWMYRNCPTARDHRRFQCRRRNRCRAVLLALHTPASTVTGNESVPIQLAQC